MADTTSNSNLSSSIGGSGTDSNVITNDSLLPTAEIETVREALLRGLLNGDRRQERTVFSWLKELGLLNERSGADFTELFAEDKETKLAYAVRWYTLDVLASLLYLAPDRWEAATPVANSKSNEDDVAERTAALVAEGGLTEEQAAAATAFVSESERCRCVAAFANLVHFYPQTWVLLQGLYPLLTSANDTLSPSVSRAVGGAETHAAALHKIGAAPSKNPIADGLFGSPALAPKRHLVGVSLSTIITTRADGLRSLFRLLVLSDTVRDEELAPAVAHVASLTAVPPKQILLPPGELILPLDTIDEQRYFMAVGAQLTVMLRSGATTTQETEAAAESANEEAKCVEETKPPWLRASTVATPKPLPQATIAERLRWTLTATLGALIASRAKKSPAARSSAVVPQVDATRLRLANAAILGPVFAVLRCRRVDCSADELLAGARAVQTITEGSIELRHTAAFAVIWDAVGAQLAALGAALAMSRVGASDSLVALKVAITATFTAVVAAGETSGLGGTASIVQAVNRAATVPLEGFELPDVLKSRCDRETADSGRGSFVVNALKGAVAKSAQLRSLVPPLFRLAVRRLQVLEAAAADARRLRSSSNVEAAEPRKEVRELHATASMVIELLSSFDTNALVSEHNAAGGMLAGAAGLVQLVNVLPLLGRVSISALVATASLALTVPLESIRDAATELTLLRPRDGRTLGNAEDADRADLPALLRALESLGALLADEEAHIAMLVMESRREVSSEDVGSLRNESGLTAGLTTKASEHVASLIRCVTEQRDRIEAAIGNEDEEESGAASSSVDQPRGEANQAQSVAAEIAALDAELRLAVGLMLPSPLALAANDARAMLEALAGKLPESPDELAKVHAAAKSLAWTLIEVTGRTDDPFTFVAAVNALAWIALQRLDGPRCSGIGPLLTAALHGELPQGSRIPPPRVATLRLRLLDAVLAVCDHDQEGATVGCLDEGNRLRNAVLEVCRAPVKGKKSVGDAETLRVAGIHALGPLYLRLHRRWSLPFVMDLATDAFRLDPNPMCKAAAAAMLSFVATRIADGDVVVDDAEEVSKLRELGVHMRRYASRPQNQPTGRTSASSTMPLGDDDLTAVEAADHDDIIRAHGQRIIDAVTQAGTRMVEALRDESGRSGGIDGDGAASATVRLATDANDGSTVEMPWASHPMNLWGSRFR